MDPATIALLGSALIPLLSSLFSSSGQGATSLLTDPTVAPLIKSVMFGTDARTLPVLDQNGQVAFDGPNLPGALGLQYADMLRNDPLKAAITHLAGSLLPTSAGFNNGVFPLLGSFRTGADPTLGNTGAGSDPTNPATPDKQTAGSSGTPGNGTGAGTSPRGRQLSMPPPSLSSVTPTLPQILAQLRGPSSPGLAA